MFKKLITELYYRYYLKGFKRYETLKENQKDDIRKINERQIKSLNALLTFSFKNIPYYRNILKDTGLVSNGEIRITSLEDMKKIPALTKDIIRQEGENLYNPASFNKSSYFNTSGGSTGEPIKVLQDSNYAEHNFANYLLISSWRKPNIFDSEVVLWGAHRDSYGSQNSLKGKVIDFVLNRKTFNTAQMTNQEMQVFIDLINKKKPSLIFAYVNSIYEVAIFAEKNNLKIEPQKCIHTGAGTLHEFMREKIEKVFSCKIFNHYGGRETGALASECNAHDGLHILSDLSYLEIVDDHYNLLGDEEEGEILVTTLNNFSMPLIRYKVGDRAVKQKYSKCSCGCNYTKLQKISGRSSDNFKNVRGDVISGEYLTLTFNAIKGVEKFQIVQNDLLVIDIYLVINQHYDSNIEEDLKIKFKKLFTDSVMLNVHYSDFIPPTQTGKHLYTISKVK